MFTLLPIFLSACSEYGVQEVQTSETPAEISVDQSMEACLAIKPEVCARDLATFELLPGCERDVLGQSDGLINFVERIDGATDVTVYAFARLIQNSPDIDYHDYTKLIIAFGDHRNDFERWMDSYDYGTDETDRFEVATLRCESHFFQSGPFYRVSALNLFYGAHQRQPEFANSVTYNIIPGDIETIAINDTWYYGQEGIHPTMRETFILDQSASETEYAAKDIYDATMALMGRPDEDYFIRAATFYFPAEN